MMTFSEWNPEQQETFAHELWGPSSAWRSSGGSFQILASGTDDLVIQRSLENERSSSC